MMILIVDDIETNRKLLRVTLEAEGIETREAGDGEEALALLEREPVDAVISDIAMPRMDGFRLCHEIRKSNRFDSMCVLFYTSDYVSADDEKFALEVGADGFFRKPAPTQQIIEALQQCHHSRRGASEDFVAKYGERLSLKVAERTAQLDATREQAEKAQRESEERFRALSESVPIGIFECDAEGRCTYINAYWTKLSGQHPAEGLEFGWANAIHPEDRSWMLERWRSAPTSLGFEWSDQCRVLRSDGAVRWLRTHVTARCNQAGKVIGFVGSFEDVTEQKEAESQLRLQGAALEAAANGIVITDRTGVIQWVNHAFCTMTGYEADEIIGEHTRILKSGAHDKPFYKKLWSTILRGEVWQGEMINRRKDGSLYTEEMTITPVVANGGEVSHFIAIKQDVTERKQAQEQICKQAELIDLAQDAIIVRDLNGCIEFWNRGAERLYGWNASEVIGRNITELIYDNIAPFETAQKHLLEKGTWSGELSIRSKDKKPIVVSSRWTLVRDEAGQPKSVLAIHTDITEKKKLESQFLRAQRLESIGTLASGVAHDLNNILAPILMSAPLLRGELSAHTKESLLSTIETSAQRGADIVKQVLTFARGIEGERFLVQPVHLIKEMTKIAQQTFPKSITITPRYSDRIWSVEGDPTQLHQVLLNLCINARDAMPTGGNLIIAAENFTVDENYASMMPGLKPGAHVLIQVTDTGTGIPREILDKIFDPFFTTKEHSKGTGLGLSTLLGIVKGHGGFVSVYSEPGHGTTFKVFLPAKETGDTGSTAKAERTLPFGHGELILVVDDEPGILQVTQTLLEKYGYKVVTAADGTDALAVYARQINEISAVLTDMMMPFMDGVTFIRTLKKMNPDVKAIACTGRGEERRMAELKALGVPICLTKPYNMEKLLTTMREVLDSNPVF